MSKHNLPLAILVALLPAGVFVACEPKADEVLADDGEDEVDPGDTTGDGDGPSGAGPAGPSGAGGSSGPGGPSSGAGNAPTSGAGGESTSGSGGDSTSGSGGASSSGAGGMGAVCHDLCLDGDKLDPSCDPCAAQICDPNVDPYCCDTAWDATCIDEVESVCGLDTCVGGSSGSGGGGPGPNPIAPGDLVITEVMNNPKAVLDSAGEWFEIKNVSGADIDLSGLVIRHDAVDPLKVHPIAASVVVPAGGYAVLGLSADKAANGNVDVDYVYPAAVNLANATDYLAIQTADSPPVVIDFVTWDEASGLDPDGASRSLSPAAMSAASNDDDTNFCAATTTIPGSTDEGTPGASNDSCP